jgi:hypothetical protein
MAETANIARMAEILSSSLFGDFLWQRTGPTNQNWPCEDQEKHNAKTHPSDVVFYYDNPYTLARTYVNCDLKSYASGSIKPGRIGAAVESLARSLSCAEKSAAWQKLFLHDYVTAEICGLLFVYNHDGEYDRGFRQLLEDMEPKLDDIPKRSKIVVLGPDDIFWLNNVRYEIVQMRGKGILPAASSCKFYYPHLSRKKNVQLDKARAATLEMLTSPWIILSYQHEHPERKGYVIFYRRRGEFVEEFLYLIDYLMHYQVFVGNTDVKIKTLVTDPSAAALFKKAIDEYSEECENSDDIRSRLTAIEYSQIGQVMTRFSDIEIGMDNG